MVFTTKFKVLVGIILASLAMGGLTFNQYTLQKQLNTQVMLDTKVMKNDQKIWMQVQKVASAAAAQLSPTPTPKLLVTHKALTK